MRGFALVVALCVGLLALPGAAVAETIHLKGGSKVSGRIVEKTDDAVKIEVDVEGGKAVLSIKRERIDRIEEATTFAERLKVASDQVAALEFKKAEEELRDLLRMDPRHAGTRRALAGALYGQYRYEEAAKTLEHYLLLVQTNRDPELMLQLATYYLEAENYRDARKTAREAADLYPENRDIGARVDDFLKRIERVKSGAEQLKERETAERAEIRRRREERATFDKTRGSNFNAQKAANELLAWSNDGTAKLVVGVFVDIGAPDDAVAAYMAGGEEKDFQDKVTRVQATVRIDPVRWAALWDHEKAANVYGWYYQLRARYPRANPVVTVVSTAKEGAQEKDKLLARGSWDGRKEQVVMDRWTKENRQPGRPIRRIVK